MVEYSVADMAKEKDLRAAVSEARRAAELRNGQNPDQGTAAFPSAPAWSVQPGSLAEAVYWHRLLAGHPDATGPEAVAAALINLGNSWRTDQRWTDAEAAFREGLQISREYGNRSAEGQALVDLGRLYQARERWSDAEAAFTQGLAIARQCGHPWTEAAALGGLGLSQAALGQTAKAIEYLEQAVAGARRSGDRFLAQRLQEQLDRMNGRSG
jgi:tetratricopeptide (TPR) repeat protein